VLSAMNSPLSNAVKTPRKVMSLAGRASSKPPLGPRGARINPAASCPVGAHILAVLREATAPAPFLPEARNCSGPKCSCVKSEGVELDCVTGVVTLLAAPRLDRVLLGAF
jgi:hypothetical protein